MRALVLPVVLLAVVGCSGATESTSPRADAALDATADVPDAVISCLADRVRCGDRCVDPRSDPTHCGACDHRCANSEICTDGRCLPMCATGQSVCGEGSERRCVDTSNDPAHCGRCGNTCTTAQRCTEGACVPRCPQGELFCSVEGTARCVDATSHAAHCGRCDNRCAPGEACSAGTCRRTCPAGQTACGDVCVDTRSDGAHCGTCGNPCSQGRACVDGACTLACGAGQTACGERCVDIRADPAHCGRCDNACPAGQSCVDGACRTVCPARQTVCDGRCTDTSTDEAHCGRCNNPCAAGLSCVGGTCTLRCADGQRACGGRCVDTARDEAHCGTCNNPCPTGRSCSAGACLPTCPMGQIDCSGRCVTTASDPAHCGACGRACAPGEACSEGTCRAACAPGETSCRRADGTTSCVDTLRDPAHCGRCDNACPGGQSCVGGSCRLVCPAGQSVCGDRCVDTRSHDAHCGRCDNACAPGLACVEGVCALLCPRGELACDGRCVDPETSSAHCGRCGNACTAGYSCVAGTCRLVCPMGQTECDGRCVDTNGNTSHCGRCGNACTAGYSCVTGTCRLVCPTGQTECDGRCVDTADSVAHCGRCGNACAAGRSCVAGTCRLVCPMGQTECGGTCVDLQTDAAHCGRCGVACGATERCSAGACRSMCEAPATACVVGGTVRCVDTATDAAHCGRCNNPCAAGLSCVAGTCTLVCPPGRTACDGRCVDPQTDAAHCGRCDNVCAGSSCVAGACAATPPVARVTVTPTRILRDDAHRTLVTLDASGSTGSGLSFAWTIPDARLEPGSSFSDATVRVRLPGTGDHPWSLRVRNSGGESSVAGVVRTNRRPVAIAESVGITRPGTAVSASGTRSFDGDGDPLSYHWTFRTRPTGSSATLMGATSATASFVPDVVGTYVLSLVVRDGLEDSEAAATHVVVEGSDIDRPTVTVTARPAAVGAVASAFTLCVNATDASPIDSRSLTVAGATVSLGSDGCGSWSSTTAGRFDAVGIARDRQGNLGRGTLALFVHASPRGTPPTVALTAPAEGAVLSAPTDVVGTATDTDLAEWTLELTPVQGSSAQIVARGNTSVSTARLAALVPNALAPGMYDLRLCAEDTHGQRACTPPRPIEIAERGIRPGALRIGVLDAVQDLLGVSLQLARIYDSRFRAVGDFGYGWTLETSAYGRIHVMTDPSTGWAETGGCARLPFRPSFRENRLHRWTVTIGREQQRFRMNLVPGACITGGVQLSVNFTPESGSTGSLVTLDGSDGLLYLHSDQTIYFDDLTPWNPRRFRYTSANGVVYEFDVGRGLTALDDGAGTRIEFGASGITVAGASAGIGLTRDSQRRITRLTLPDGRARTYRYDNAGDLVGATDFAGQETRYRYDLDHRLIEVIDPRGAAPASLTFDNEGRVTGLRDATGHTVELRWDTPQRHVTTDRLGHTTTYNYDSNGNVTSVVDALGNTRSFTYDSNLRMTSATDPLGNVTRYEYDSRGNQTAIVDPLGHRWTSTYDAQGRLTARSDPTGAVERFEYDARGHMTGYVNPLGGRMAFVNDSRGRPTRITNPAGGVLALTRDSAGRLTGYTDALGGTGTVLSRPDGEVARETFRFGGRDVSWEQVFDMAGRLTGGTTPDGASWTLGYDRAGAVEHFTDTEGRTQRFVLDASGTLTAMVAGDGRSVTLTRDREDRIVGATLPHGGTVQRSLDALGRPTRVVLPNGITLSTGYDAAGRVTSQSTTFGGVERFTYDAAGRPTGATLPNGATIAYEYDAAGRRTALVDALGRRTTFGYDALGNLTRVTFPDGAATTSSFDSSGRLTSFVDERGATLRFTYDAANQLIGAQSAAGETTTYTYDGAGGLAGATMPSGATWSFTRSATGALRSVRTPWGGETQWERLPNGRITRTIDPTGTVLRYEYDDAGRMTARVPPTASEAERRSFGAGGRVLAATGPSGMTTWAYDAQGRVRRVTHPDGSFVEYTYDARGRRATVQTPAGTTRYLYDDNTGWLTAVEDTLGGRSSFTYDAAGRLTGEVLADGTRHTLTRNLRGQRTHDRLTDAGGSVLWEESYTRDPAGNVTRANETVSGRAVDYSYDTAGRVAREVRTGPDAADEHYAYDRDDNLTRIGARTFTIDRTRLMSDGSVTYTYDAAGRRTGRSGAGRTETYRYDAFDRLVEVTRTGATPARVTLAYDANGLLRSIEADGVRRTLLWDSERVVPVLLEERDGAGRLLAHYVHGTHPLAVVGEGGSVAVLHRDGLGSVRVRTEGGRVVSRFGYSAFGAPTLGASDPTRLRHAGEYWIPELGLTYLRARFYDPAVGRFLTPDPRAPEPDAPTTFNPYTYAGNNPVRFTDPRGEFSLGNVSIAVSVVSTLASIALPNFDIAGFFVRGLGLDVPFTDIVGVNVQLGLSYGAGSFGAGGGLSLDYASSGGTTLRAVSMFVTFSLQFGGNNIARTFPRNRIEAIAQTGPIFGDASEPQSEPTCNAALAISGGLAQKVVQYFRTRGLGLSFANDAWRRSAFELSFGIFDNIRVSRSGVSANWSFSLRKFGFGATALPNVTSSIFDGTSRQDIDLSPRTDYFSAISSYLYIPLWHSLDNRQFPNIWEMLGAMLF